MPWGWQSPMPFRMGGAPQKLIADLYATAKAGSGSLLNGEPGTETDLENIVLARMIAIGWRIAQAAAVQGDPRKLSDLRRLVTFPDGHTEDISPLERWERIFELRPRSIDTVTQRRYAVYLRQRLTGRSDRGTLMSLLALVFGSWTVTWTEQTSADANGANCFWPGATNTPAYPGTFSMTRWYNEIGWLLVSVYVPPGTSSDEVARRNALFLDIFDLVLPAPLDWYVQYL